MNTMNKFPVTKNGAMAKPPSYLSYLLGLLYPFGGKNFVFNMALFLFVVYFIIISNAPDFNNRIKDIKPIFYVYGPVMIVTHLYLFINLIVWCGIVCNAVFFGFKYRGYEPYNFLTKSGFKGCVAYFSKFGPGVNAADYRRTVRAGFARTKTEFACGAFMQDCMDYFEQWTIAYRDQKKSLARQVKELRRNETEARKMQAERAVLAKAKAVPAAKPSDLRSDPRKFAEEYGYAQGVKGLPMNSGVIEQELQARFGRRFEDCRRAYAIGHSVGHKGWIEGRSAVYKTPLELRGVPLMP